ncbi:MAG TPA: glycosyltransferase family 2 protein [Gammaproteobacteria bacterium]
MKQISAVIIAGNASRTIARTLESLAAFPEVVVYANGSTDGTAQIAETFPNTRVVNGEFVGFGPTKNRAAEHASNDWIFSIDADEYVDRELVDAVAAVDLDDADVTYAVERRNLFMGKLVTHGGWGNDWLVRLYNRKRCRFNDSVVHEEVDVPRGCRTVRLPGFLWHEAVTELDQILQKISRYSELRRTDGARTYSPAVILLRSFWAFFRSYVLKAGFLEGWRGVVIAFGNATGTFFRHMKRYADKAFAAEQAAEPASTRAVLRPGPR